MNGTVKYFNEQRGYGFIAGENGIDYFIHIHDILNADKKYPEIGQPVCFETEKGEKGYKALAARLL